MYVKNQEIILQIDNLGCNGEGVAHVDGYTFFVPYALVGEEVRAKILKATKSFAYAKIVEILSASPSRMYPVCPVFSKCGGCNLQHMEYVAQLKFKQNEVSGCFKKIAGLDLKVLPTVPSEESVRYRNKLQLPVREQNGKVVVGFFRENSHDVIEIDDCYIQREWAAKLIAIIKQFVAQSGNSCYNEITGRGVIKHIVAREVSGRLLIVLVLTADKLKNQHILLNLLDKEFSGYSLFFNINKLNNNVVLSNDNRLVRGESKINYCEQGIEMPMGPLSFMQVNDSVRNKIYENVIDNISSEFPVIDAYSGAGFMTALLAKKAPRVYGIECVQEAVDCADILAQNNGLSKKIKNYCGKCEDVLPELIAKLRKENTGVSVVLDPPRKGCDLGVINALIDCLPDKIVYVSCNPSTLARDVGLLVGSLKYNGKDLVKDNEYTARYSIDYVKPFDMFPSTKHVESVVCLSRK